MQIKASPGAATAAAQVGNETSLTPDRVARAKAAFSGQEVPKSSGDPQVDRINNIRTIKMKTQVSTDRPIELPEEEPVVESAISDTDSNEQVEAADDTKPLSPQFAALAKQKRALQVKESELAKREAALAAGEKGTDLSAYISKADLLANPSLIFENGVTYDALTEAILSGSTGANPEIKALQDKIEALEKGVESKLTERDQQAEQQVLDSFKREADKLAFSGDDFELVREMKQTQTVVDLMHRIYKETGEIMEVVDAMREVESDLLEQNLKVANYKKIQSSLSAQSAPNKSQSMEQRPGIKTLTNRDTARPIEDRRARAIAAMQGTLKR